MSMYICGVYMCTRVKDIKKNALDALKRAQAAYFRCFLSVHTLFFDTLAVHLMHLKKKNHQKRG